MGVRWSVYIHTFCTLLLACFSVPRLLPLDHANSTRGVFTKLETMHIRSTLLGFALLISSTFQAHSAGLTVYDALILLNLNWIIILGALLPVRILLIRRILLTRTDGIPLFFQGRIPLTTCLLTFHLTATSAFGLWLFATINTFDRTNNGCTQSTIYYMFGKHTPVMHLVFRLSSITIYSLFLLPVVNIFFVHLVEVTAAVGVVCIVHTIMPVLVIVVVSFSYLEVRLPARTLRIWAMVCSLMWYGCPLVTMIIWTEKAITLNNADAGENAWSLGKSLALLLAAFAVVRTSQEVWMGVQRLQS